MKDRFTHQSRTGRHSISKKDRAEVYLRDNYTCLYCKQVFAEKQLTIDHVHPVNKQGLHEIRNFVTCCKSCNSSKKDRPLLEFAKKRNIDIEQLPIHGDPVLDNATLPKEIHQSRKTVFQKMRTGEKTYTGKGAQQKIEKDYRRAVWHTHSGQKLTKEYPNLPGHARVILFEIDAIAKSEEDKKLLIELSKSAKTKNLISTANFPEGNVLEIVTKLIKRTNDEALKKRLIQALKRASNGKA